MALSDISDPNAIVESIKEFDKLGRDAFLQRYGFGKAKQYFLVGEDGRRYDSKALVGAAHGFQFPERGHLGSDDFSGEENTVKALLERLGFRVTGPDAGSSDPGKVASSEAQQKGRVWVEKTTVNDRPDRAAGPNRLGESLWSPQAAADGRDIYANMRDVQPGDVVLHLTDNEAFTGVSSVAEAVDTSFQGVSGTAWGDRPCYRIQLRNFVPLHPSLHRDWLFKDETAGAQLRDIAEQPRGRGLFYNPKLELNQGAYLTAVPDALLEVLRQVYHQQTGNELPMEPRSGQTASTLNESRLGAALRIFRWVYGASGFSSDRYLQHERDYKAAFSEKWRALLTQSSLDTALASDDASVALATEIGRLLTDAKISNLLPWRYAGVLKGTWAPDRARAFLAATRQLLFESPRAMPAVDEFNAAMAPFYAQLLAGDGVKPASHCIPSMMLWLSEPDLQFFVRPDLYNQACRSLLGSVADGQGSIMSTAYYVRAREFASSVGTLLARAGAPARDMIDVQGFLWGVFNASRVWFGGHSYKPNKQNVNMLAEFVANSIYATDWACSSEVADFFTGVSDLSADHRKTRKAELEKALTKDGERKALSTLFDLIGRSGAMLFAKAVWYDQKSKQSLIRISGVADTKGTYSFDTVRGHQLQVEWLSEFSETFVLPGRLFPLLNGTLASLPIADALDVFSTPYTAIAGVEMEKDETDIERSDVPLETKVNIDRVPYALSKALEGLFMPQEDFERLLRIWRQKQNLVLQGAPGVGKSFVARRLAYSLIGYEDPSRVQMIQFHQSYAYEDFVQGFRPTADGKFALRDGVFVDFCNKALSDPGETYVLIIDEINRGNLSKILGELMLLIEVDKRSAKWAVKLAYSDADAPKFHIPDNLYLLGLMNTADRSLAVVDYALRRRFAFVTLRPSFDQAKFHDHLAGAGASIELVKRIVERLTVLNDRIASDLTNLGPGFCVGHSFFVANGSEPALDDDWYKQIVETEIAPLLHEYWFDNPVEADRWTKDLLA